MRLLAVDTATEICGVALTTHGSIDAQVVLNHGQTHTRHVMEAIDSVLTKAQVALASIDAFVVTQGPGSFTGLRIGISSVKGLAMAMGKPMVGISTLAVLAHQAETHCERICPVIDARRNELYWTLFKHNNDRLEVVLPEQVGPAAQIPAHVDAPCLFIGNGIPLYRDELQGQLDFPAQWAPPEQCRLQPAVLAELGRQKLKQGRQDDVMTFGPVYLRKSDAEIQRETRAEDPNGKQGLPTRTNEP